MATVEFWWVNHSCKYPISARKKMLLFVYRVGKTEGRNRDFQSISGPWCSFPLPIVLAKDELQSAYWARIAKLWVSANILISLPTWTLLRRAILSWAHHLFCTIWRGNSMHLQEQWQCTPVTQVCGALGSLHGNSNLEEELCLMGWFWEKLTKQENFLGLDECLHKACASWDTWMSVLPMC